MNLIKHITDELHAQGHPNPSLWWLVVAELSPYCQIYEVSTTQVKKYATGKGTASKMEVMAAAIKRYPRGPASDHAEAADQ